MFDIVLESIRAFILIGLIFFLLKQEKSVNFSVGSGWRFIIVGFGLLLFGSVLDITDNFEALNKFVIIGDTEVEALLEKLVGFLGGFIFLAIGLVKWIPGNLKGIQASEELFQKAFHSSPALMTVSRPSDGHHFDVNESWCTITGYSYLEASKNNSLDLGIWENPDDRAKFMEQLENDGSSRGMETVFRTKNGQLIDMLVAGEFIEVDGRKRLLFIGQDITRLKEIERLKSEFVSIVSHELRTPLTSISGAIGLMLGGAAGKLPDKALEMTEIAQHNCERLGAIINDILDFEKMHSGAMEFSFGKLNLNDLVAETLEQCVPFAEEFKVTFVQVNSASNVFIYGDHQRLSQVLMNLLSNAAKFSPSGETVEIRIAKNDETARVEVADQGCGISKEFHDRVFEKFAQEASPNTRTAPGTGLGLSISKSIIGMHQGTIGFDSALDAGSTFYFEIPLDISAMPSTSTDQDN